MLHSFAAHLCKLKADIHFGRLGPVVRLVQTCPCTTRPCRRAVIFTRAGSMMEQLPVRRLLAAALLLAAPAAPGELAAQLPTASDAQALLQTRPDLVKQLRQRITTSGLTPDQIRSRLRAAGYNETLFDAYLPGAAPTPSTSGMATEVDVLTAAKQLGIVDSTELTPAAAQTEPSAATVPNCDELISDSSAARKAGCPPYSTTSWTSRYTNADSGRAIFGLDIFRTSTSQFDANLAGPVDESYKINAGDRLVLILTGDVEVAHTLDVTREGFIVIPQVGQLQVANLTLAQLQDLLYTRLGRVYSGVRRGPSATTHFSVSLARLRINQVYVTGDVMRPGSYRVSSTGTAMTALYAAHGPTDNGGLRTIEVRRGGKTVSTLDVYDYLLHGDASHDVRLETGDIVFVPVHGPRVRIVGEVTRPATYELKPNETLADLIAAAGGFTAEASRRRVQIERIVPPDQRTPGGRDRVVIDISSVSRRVAEEASPVQMQPGDVVRVFTVSDRVRNRITVDGNVWSPGPQGFTPGMKIVDALKLAGGVKPDAYLGDILVTRTRADSTRVQLRAMLRDTSGLVSGDFPLQEDDEVRVFSVSEFRPKRFVAITGAVRKPGRYPYREGMTMRDLVLLAGGMNEGALVQEAEIARLPEARTEGQTAATFRVPLDSSYVFERETASRVSGSRGMAVAEGRTAPEVTLAPYDNVLILRQPDWELQRTVALTGEVRFPGRYALRTKSERLSDVIARAGGLTKEAYPQGVYFIRPQSGRIGIDLADVLKNPKNRDNMLLVDGDSIYVPRYNGVVTVKGAVNSPVAVAFVPGQSIDFYIRSAGGPQPRADVSRAYVTQPNGKVESVVKRRFWPDSHPAPQAGGVVMVPEKSPADAANFLAQAATMTSVLTALAALAAVIAQIKK
jgi:protein involved in polysaccharide export with SLBB domain